MTGFLGPNGAGKTTTLRMLLGLAEPDGGRRAACSAVRFAALERPATPRRRRARGRRPPPRAHGARPPAGARACGRRAAEPRARGAGAGRADRRRRAPRGGLLARDAPAPRARGRPARRARAADPRRARQRAGSRGRALAARLPARLRRHRRDGADLEPSPRRGRADGRPGRGHPSRAAGGRVAAARAHRPARRDVRVEVDRPAALEMALRSAQWAPRSAPPAACSSTGRPLPRSAPSRTRPTSSCGSSSPSRHRWRTCSSS